MSKKLRIAAPLCGLLAVAVIALFCITGFAAGDEETSAQAVTVETMSAQGIEAPTKNLETLAPVQNVTQGEQNPEEEEENGSLAPTGVSPYELTDEERIAVECAVMCEAGGEEVRGQMMVAQCILDGAQRNGISVIDSIAKYQVASTSYSRVTEQVKESVSRVFDDGERVTEEKADLWYNPALVQSSWHEQQHYVITIGLHRFFWMNDDT
jgi:spore germination cell wall hydrolase CwlJ-like protein